MEETLNELIAFRKQLHQYPEVSGNEHQTQQCILSFLSNAGIEGVPIGGTGVMVVFDSNVPGKTIMLRSDHDALPIEEVNDFEYKSVHQGVSHKCGHDGHTAIMCGVAKYFKNYPPKKGRVVLIFQPAEENGEGAKAVLNDANFSYTPDIAIALHNIPGYEKNRVIYRVGSFTAAAKSIIIRLDGKTSHAAEPEKGINPAPAIADMIQLFEKESQPLLDREDFALTTPVHIQMGERSYGVSAGHGEVHYTLRTWNNETMDRLTERILTSIEAISNKYGLRSAISWTEEFDANQNSETAVKLIEDAIATNDLSFEIRSTPFKWGEDFGLFTKQFGGAMFGIGSGIDCPALHNPDYDFPDEIIATGINMFTSITEKALNE